MNLLFLDFDGVWIIHKVVNIECANRLKRLIQEMNLYIVITSNWRMDRDPNKAHNIVAKYISRDRILGATDINDLTRKNQINQFLRKYQYSKILIIDDNLIDGYDEFTIITDPDEGFSERCFQQAVTILNRQGDSKL